MPDVRFFTRDGCRLCEAALAVVEEELRRLLGAHKLAFTPCSCGPTSIVRHVQWRDGSVLHVFDVDAEHELKRRFGFEVPVVEVVGGQTFTLQLDRAEFAAALRSAPPEARA